MTMATIRLCTLETGGDPCGKEMHSIRLETGFELFYCPECDQIQDMLHNPPSGATESVD